MKSLSEALVEFVREQPMFFVATAPSTGRVNVSPKGMDSLRVVAPDRIVWLNLTGSGNETAAHVAENHRMTLMFMSISAMPMILRVYGTARVVHPRHAEWDDLIGLFPTLSGSRQIFDLAIDHAATSCGTGVPVMRVDDVRADRELEPFYAAMTRNELADYWSRKNTTSLDGRPTNILSD
jgi:Pyridoxamine 5'-phosphate oxidase